MGLFDKTFKEKKGISSSVIDSISERELPCNFKYKEDENAKGLFIATPEDGIKTLFLNISKLEFDGEKFESEEELAEYLYRTQKEFEYTEDYLIINGEKIPRDKWFVDPLNKYNMNSSKVTIIPNKFPELTNMIFKDRISNKEYVFNIARMPTKEKDIILIESNNNNLIKIFYKVNEKTKDFTFKITVKTNNISTIEDVKYLADFYIAMFNENLELIGCGIIKGECKNEKIKEFFEFWNKVYELVRYTGIKFEFKDNVNVQESELIEKLYRCIILENNYKEFSEVQFFEMVNEENRKKYYEDLFQNNFGAFSYKEYENVNILGKQVKINYIVVWFDLMFEKLEEKQEDDKFLYKIYVKSRKNKKMFKVERMFLDERSADNYHKYVLSHLNDIYKENSKGK